MKRSNNITWWDFRVPRLENWLRPDNSSLSGPDQTFLKQYAEETDFIDELLPFINHENIQVANVVAANNLQSINSKIGSSGSNRFKWLLYLGITAAITISLWYLGNLEEEQAQYMPRDNSYQIALQPEQPEIVSNKVLAVEKQDEQESITKKHSNENQVSTAVQEDKNITEAVIDTTVPLEVDKSNKVSKPVSGFRVIEGQTRISDSRDPTVPLQLNNVHVARKDNYWVFLNSGTTKADDISVSPSDMPRYHGGDERLIEDLAYFIRKNTFSGTYEKTVSVLVSFVIDPKGKMDKIDIRYANSAEIKSCVEKALNDLELWQRGSKFGKKGSMYYEIAISFN